MSYKLNKTDGSLLVELVDGRLDTTSADIALIGKNYQGFGESINENFIKMLENFSNTTAPSKPIKGQLWYDTAEGRLKIYDGITFRSTDSTIYSSSQPSELIEGDIWIDGSKDQLFFWNGTETILVGPKYTKNQLRTGDFVETIRDTTGQNKIVTKRYLNGSLVGIEAKSAFTPFPAIVGFTDLKIGFNISTAFPDYSFHGKANSAENLIGIGGQLYDYTSFLSTDFGGTVKQEITIASDDGLVIGRTQDTQFKVQGNTTVLKNIKPYNDFKIALTEVSGGGSNVEFDALYFDADTKRLGIFQTTLPQYTVDVAGDMRVTGDLIVEGDTVALEVQKLVVQDKQIELGQTDDSTPIDKTQADDAGVVVKISNGDDIRWTWRSANENWTSSHSINLENLTDEFSIGGTSVLSKQTLGDSVINSKLTTVGQLESLAVGSSSQVHKITISEDSIYCSTALNITSTGDITFNNQVIKNVADPVDLDDVATKNYVDVQVASQTIITGIDVTGLGTDYAPGAYGDGTCDDQLIVAIKGILDELSPAVSGRNGTVAKIHAVYYEANTDPIDINTNIVKSLQAVDSAGVQNVNVLRDIIINDPTATVNLTANRLVITIEIATGIWDVNTGVIAVSAV